MTGPARFNMNRLGTILEEAHERLAGVTIENLDWRDFIDRYDRADTLFYLDPPYFGNEGDYGKALFSRADFAALADRLAGIQGRFVLSLNDHPEVREIFQAFTFFDVNLAYTVSGGEGTAAAEVVIVDRKEPGITNAPLG